MSSYLSISLCDGFSPSSSIIFFKLIIEIVSDLGSSTNKLKIVQIPSSENLSVMELIIWFVNKGKSIFSFSGFIILYNSGFFLSDPKLFIASTLSFGDVSSSWLISNKSKDCFNSVKSPSGRGISDYFFAFL